MAGDGTRLTAGGGLAVPSTPPSRYGRGGSKRRRSYASLLYVAPALVLYSVFLVAPWAQSIWISFFDWDGIGRSEWVGLGNYSQVLQDPDLRVALTNAFGFILYYTIVPLLLGLIIAATIAARRRRGVAIVRTIIFLPQILPLVAVGVVWRFLYSADGPINTILRHIGLGDLAATWLGDFNTAFMAVGLVGTWVTTGLCTMLLLAGMQKIDPAIYEAARMDGANALSVFRYITVPSLRNEIVIGAIITMIAALASFDVVYVTTQGGPGTTTTVPGVLIYQLVFTSNRVGTACALATMLSAIMICLVLVLNRVGRER